MCLLFCGILSEASGISRIVKSKCEAEEYGGKYWPETKLGKSAFNDCVGLGFYRRICIFEEESSGTYRAKWGEVESKCRMFPLFACFAVIDRLLLLGCPEEGQWKESNAYAVEQISCPPGYVGSISRECSEDGTWNKIVDHCIFINDEL